METVQAQSFTMATLNRVHRASFGKFSLIKLLVVRVRSLNFKWQDQKDNQGNNQYAEFGESNAGLFRMQPISR